MSSTTTNLKNVNFMSETRFDNLSEIKDDELYAVKFDAVKSSDLDSKADKNLVNTGYLTNCILEMPNNLIKLETNNNDDVILKAGSKLYFPNGVNNFEEVITPSDINLSATTAVPDTGGKYCSLLFFKRDLSYSSIAGKDFCYSSTTAPSITFSYTDQFWWDLANNQIHSNETTSGDSWNTSTVYSLPIRIDHIWSGGPIYKNVLYKIHRTNAIGFMGSTVFALPGIKVSIPDGRKDNGTLKNSIGTTSEVSILTATSSHTGEYNVTIANTLKLYNFASTPYYNKYTNYFLDNSGNALGIMYAAKVKMSSGVITAFESRTDFNSADYNSDLSAFSMPSGKYADMTLRSSGTSYTAPANGYVFISKTGTAAGQYVNLTNDSAGLQGQCIGTGSGNGLVAFIPVKKGDNFSASYSAAGTTNVFRFIYAEGEVAW